MSKKNKTASLLDGAVLLRHYPNADYVFIKTDLIEEGIRIGKFPESIVQIYDVVANGIQITSAYKCDSVESLKRMCKHELMKHSFHYAIGPKGVYWFGSETISVWGSKKNGHDSKSDTQL